MNLKIHAKGSSFKGISQYLLHDPNRARSADRVAWTQTVNLATDDADLAWKLMAATALDAKRLKAEAGIKNTGRKSDKTVLHLTLSWHPEEKKDLIPEEMMRAARFAIRELGADDRQALVVCHSDKKQPHVHVVINRVSSTDGRLLSSSFERQKLSDFGERYERERGKIYCKQRVINNAARKRGTFTRGEKDIPRAAFEQIRANDNSLPRDEVKKIWLRHRGKDRDIGARQRKTRHAQTEAWARLQGGYRAKRAAVLGDLRAGLYRVKRRVQDEYKPEWDRRYAEREAALKGFQRDERKFLGRLRNRARSIDLRAIVMGEAKGRAIRDAFTAMGSAGARLELLKDQQDRLDARLERREKIEIRERSRPLRTKANSDLARDGRLYQAERASVVLTNAVEQAKMRAEWAQRGAQRRDELQKDIDMTGANRRRTMLDSIRRSAFNDRSERDRNQDGRDR